jgi:hypothetical protein
MRPLARGAPVLAPVAASRQMVYTFQEATTTLQRCPDWLRLLHGEHAVILRSRVFLVSR